MVQSSCGHLCALQSVLENHFNPLSLVLWIYSQLQQEDQPVALLLACWISALLMSGQPVTPQGSSLWERPSGGGSSWRSRGRVNASKMIHRQRLLLTPWTTDLILGAQAGSSNSITASADPTSTTAKETPPMRGGSGRSAPQEEPYPSQIKKWGKTCQRRASIWSFCHITRGKE